MAGNKFLQLKHLPSYSDISSWADYVELACMLNVDRQITKAEIEKIIKEAKDLEQTASSRSLLIGSTPEKDQIRAYVEDYFRHLAFRSSSYDQSYPFALSARGETLRLKKSGRNKHYLYLFFLLSSNLHYFGQYKTRLTAAFETLSQLALREMLPERAEVHLFGSGSLGTRRYTGNKYRRIEKLAADLRTTVKIDQNTFTETDVGDAGLDIVAWIPFEDSTPHMLMYFGQCACTPEWVTKQHSSGEEAWSPLIELHTRPMNLAFIPYCFRSSNGDWSNRTKIHRSVLFDRLRLIRILGPKHRAVASDIPQEILAEVLSSSQPPA